MSDEAKNVAILKDAYDRWQASAGASVDHWLSIADPQISFGSLIRGAAPMAFATQYDNRDALRAYFEGLLGDWTMVHYTVEEYIADGDVVVARGSTAWRNKRTGKIGDTPKVDFWRFKDGKAVEFYEYFDTATVLAAATG